MNFFKQFAPLIQSGVVFRLALRAAGDKIQFDILPECDTKSTGIALVPKALTATADELDAEIPSFLATYLAATSGIKEQVQLASESMEEAVRQAKETAAKKAAEAKAKASSAPTKSLSKVVPGTSGPKKSSNASLMDDDEDEDLNDGTVADSGVQATSTAAEPPGGNTPEPAANLFL